MRIHKLEDRKIIVIDNFLSSKEINELNKQVNFANFRKEGNSTPDHAHPQWVSSLEITKHLEAPFVKRMQKLVTENYTKRLTAHRAYMLVSGYGDIPVIHADSPQERTKDITSVLYFNEKWDSEWAGELIFFDKNKDAQLAFTPKPGRMILFNGMNYHRSGLPSRDCPVPRYSMVTNFLAKL